MSRRPNVIVFLTDQQRWDSMGLHGNPLGLTPNLDRVAQRGTFLRNCISPQPVCGPARSCLQTGQYATTTGCWRNDIPLPQDRPTLATCFNEGGYRTGYIGKWHLAIHDPANPGPVRPEERGGYQSWLASNVLEFTSDAYHTRLYDEQLQEHRLPGYRVDACADAAIRWIDGHQDEPFFLFLSFIEPHHQNHCDDYPPPGGYRERYTGAWTPPDLQALGGSAPRHLGGYWGMIKRLDEAYGRLQDALLSLDLLDDTIVCFTSDHGSHFRTRNAEYKRSCHESSVHVPGVLSGPGFDGGGDLAQQVSLVDLPPTLLAAAGLPIPDSMQGQSFLPLVSDRQAPWLDEAFIQISEAEVARALRTPRWKYAVTAPDVDGCQVGTADNYQESHLYDLINDPYELDNLVTLESYAPVRDELRGRLLSHMAAKDEAPAAITPRASEPSGQLRPELFVE